MNSNIALAIIFLESANGFQLSDNAQLKRIIRGPPAVAIRFSELFTLLLLCQAWPERFGDVVADIPKLVNGRDVEIITTRLKLDQLDMFLCLLESGKYPG